MCSGWKNKDVGAVLKLSVSEAQKNFIAGNSYSIIEAYTTITENGHAFPFGIYDGDTLIGFDYNNYWGDTPQIAKGNYLLWHLMIDYQQKGYGKGAVEAALDFIRTFPCGKAEYCWLSYAPPVSYTGHLDLRKQERWMERK